MVSITTAIVVLKVFDIVFVMTGGRFNTDVVANQMYLQAFQFRRAGAVLATALSWPSCRWPCSTYEASAGRDTRHEHRN